MTHHRHSVLLFCQVLTLWLVSSVQAQPLRRLPPVEAASAFYGIPFKSVVSESSTSDFAAPSTLGTFRCDGRRLCRIATTPKAFEPWSTTEIQLQCGRLDAPSFAGGAKADTAILTFQHASGWKYGDNFFFADLVDDQFADGFNDRDVYMEWYPTLSLGRVLGRKVGCGILSDIGIIGGINYGADANFMKWLPGVRFSWDLPGFAYLNSDITAFLDDNAGAAGGGAPKETDSFMIDFSWDYPFSIGRHDFSIQGHAEFIAGRENELGNDVSWWILAQPQFRYDLGKTFFRTPNKLFVGIEWQIWPNKLGDSVTDENTVQALVVWRL